MSTKIQIVIIFVFLTIFVVLQVMCTNLSEQHGLFLYTFFIELPTTLFQRWFSIFF